MYDDELTAEVITAEEITALSYLQSIYRDPGETEHRRMRAAIAALPFENPKVSAVAISHMSGKDFASALERCLARSEVARSKEYVPAPALAAPVQHSADELKRHAGA
jgi:hypothetical protein